MPRRPRAPARPAPMIWVGAEAPPWDVEEVAVPFAAELAAPDVAAALLVAAAVELMVEFRNLPVGKEELDKLPPVPVNPAVGTAAAVAGMK